MRPKFCEVSKLEKIEKLLTNWADYNHKKYIRVKNKNWWSCLKSTGHEIKLK
jgi:hypothetical protein